LAANKTPPHVKMGEKTCGRTSSSTVRNYFRLVLKNAAFG
jgi:hypothetical protein